MTYPETAWLIQAVPSFATIATILLFALLLRGRLRTALTALLLRRAAGRRSSAYRGASVLSDQAGAAGDPTLPADETTSAGLKFDQALVWTPPIATETELMTLSLSILASCILILCQIAPVFVAIILSGPVTALGVWGALWLLEQRYRSQLDAALPAAVGRLEAQLRGASGIDRALETVLMDMPVGPLKAEWSFLVQKLGTPLAGGMLATHQVVCAALLTQTPSPRHAAFLSHVEIALSQPHGAMVQRIRAAYEALQAAERRRSSALTELSQMRYSGIAISLAGIVMALYLFMVQRDRFTLAYQGTLGLFAGTIVVGALIMPLVVGYFLSQADDLEY